MNEMNEENELNEKSDALGELIAILELDRIEENIFRGQSQDLGWGRVFGGQVIGQALSAATQTVPADRFVHSLHCYFLRSSDAHRPIVYLVDPARDGQSFTTRRVVAIQDGETVLTLAASFQIDEAGFSHQDAEMPEVTPPEELLSERELGRRYLEALPEPLRAKIPPPMRERFVASWPIELRTVEPIDPLDPGRHAPRRQVWLRTNGRLPDVATIHRYLLAYASDFQLLGTTLLPHGVTWLHPKMQVASLDHAIWYHRPFRLDDWLLYAMHAPSSEGARGLVQGRFFDRRGALVASTMQQGLIRDRRST